MIKANHFNIGEGATLGQYTSVTHNSFNFTGDAGRVRGVLDEERKKDLRDSHFSIGREKGMVNRSTNDSTYQRPGTSKVQLNTDRQKDLKASHFQVGQSFQGNFITSNQVHYKWV